MPLPISTTSRILLFVHKLTLRDGRTIRCCVYLSLETSKPAETKEPFADDDNDEQWARPVTKIAKPVEHVVLLLHGTPGSCLYMIPTQIRQIPGNAVFVCLERPGWCESSESKSTRSLDVFSADILEFVEHHLNSVLKKHETQLNISNGYKLTLLGYSGGGPFAVAALAKKQKLASLVHRLILISSPAPRSGGSTKDMSTRQKLQYWLASWSWRVIVPILRQEGKGMLARPSTQSNRLFDFAERIEADNVDIYTTKDYTFFENEIDAMFSQNFALCYERGQWEREAKEYHAFSRRSWGFSLDKAVPKHIPVTIYGSSDDQQVVPSMVRALHKRIRHSKLKMFDSVGHNAIFARFGDILDEILDNTHQS